MIKKILKMNKPGTLWNEYRKSKKGIKVPEDADPDTYWREQYENISIPELNKLKTKINKKEKDYNEYIKSLRGTIIDFPPKPLNCFSIFIKENLD